VATSSKNNRYLPTNSLSGTNNPNSNGNEVVNMVSKEARNFQKSLRKAPKGTHLDLEELVTLAETDSDKLFYQQDKNIEFLKKQSQANKQEIEEMRCAVFPRSVVTELETFDYKVRVLSFIFHF
jgi:hypothetical protein